MSAYVSRLPHASAYEATETGVSVSISQQIASCVSIRRSRDWCEHASADDVLRHHEAAEIGVSVSLRQQITSYVSRLRLATP